jgi:siderophore synthetase component
MTTSSESAHPVAGRRGLPTLSEVQPSTWREANRRLLAKALSEWSFEAMLEPVPLGGDRYRVDLASGVSYVFRARRGAFGSWQVDPGSIVRGATGLLGSGVDAPAWDVQLFMVDCASTIGTDAATLATYLTELSSTLAIDAARLQGGGTSAADLLAADHAELECHMTGHNWLVANKGRLGFSAGDNGRYAPEAQAPLRLLWIAVHRGLAEFRGTPDRSEQSLVHHELGEAAVAAFRARLHEAGLDPDAYVWLPVHPWQWDHTVQHLFAAEVAGRRIVMLGESPDEYLPQQSIRTMTNITTRPRHDVKLPLRILNTLVWRGIPPHCSLGAPLVTRWLQGLLGNDPLLRDEFRTVLLGEIASVTVQHPYLRTVPDVPYQHLEQLGCIWRESVSSYLDSDERARTFSSLLHVDGAGTAFVTALVRASGLAPEAWLRELFAVVMHPLQHVLYTYGITFNPHGQNTLIGFDAGCVPRRLFLKDFIDDVCVSHTEVPERGPEPDAHDHVLPRKDPSVIRQHVVDQVFVGHFRYLAPLVESQLGVPEARFWQLVREAVLAYHQRFPQLAHRFAEYDLLAPEFPRYALNRDRLVVTRYTDRALRHALFPNGTIPNPIAAG